MVTTPPPASHWPLPTRIAFRFVFLYFSLYAFLTQLFTSLAPIPKVDIPDLATFWPVRPILLWVAVHILRLPTPSYAETGSGDKAFDWTLVFSLLVFAAFGTMVWSVLDRRRTNYVTLHKWFRLAIRILLVGQLMGYGLAKVIPLQMPFPYLSQLLTPYGKFSPMGVLWSSIGAAPSYEIFAGFAELLAGVLILFPRTTTLGAILCMADMANVFMLNMSYDVPVKLLSFQLFLLGFFLLFPELPRFINFFFLNRNAMPSAQPELFSTPRANRIALALQILFGLWLFGMNLYSSYVGAHEYGFARVKSPLYGIWEVDQQFIDGQLRSPLMNDSGRWRRLVFDIPTRMSFERIDGSFSGHPATINLTEKTMVLTSDADKNWKANFAIDRPAPDQLILDGDMDGHKTRLHLKLLDLKRFNLISRGFHWISEIPYNR